MVHNISASAMEMSSNLVLNDVGKINKSEAKVHAVGNLEVTEN